MCLGNLCSQEVSIKEILSNFKESNIYVENINIPDSIISIPLKNYKDKDVLLNIKSVKKSNVSLKEHYFKGVRTKISIYNIDDSEYSNYDLIFKDYVNYEIVGLRYYEDSNHCYSNMIIAPGFFVIDKVRSVTYFFKIGTNSNCFIYDNIKKEEYRTLCIQNFSVNEVQEVFIMEDYPNVNSCIGWYKGNFETESYYTKSSNHKYDMETSVYSNQRCEEDILLNDMTLKSFSDLISYHECNPLLVIKEIDLKVKAPIFFYSPLYFLNCN